MLSKEEIEDVEHAIKNFNGRAIDCVAVGKMLIEYQKLESDKQKLIEKLEEDIRCGEGFKSDLEPTIPEIRAEYAQEILSIVKEY